MVCATSKSSDQPAHMRNLIRAFASCLNLIILNVKLLTEQHLEFLSLKADCTGSCLLMLKCHIVGNLVSWLIYV